MRRRYNWPRCRLPSVWSFSSGKSQSALIAEPCLVIRCQGDQTNTSSAPVGGALLVSTGADVPARDNDFLVYTGGRLSTVHVSHGRLSFSFVNEKQKILFVFLVLFFRGTSPRFEEVEVSSYISGLIHTCFRAPSHRKARPATCCWMVLLVLPITFNGLPCTYKMCINSAGFILKTLQ